MLLRRLTLINYKSFYEKTFEFRKKINCFVGDNGVGKTNVLDAIYHLAFGKGYLNNISSQNIRHDENFYMIDGLFCSQDDKEERVICSFKKGQKKRIIRNGKAYEKISDHIGQIPLVIISPLDQDLINGGSEGRRQFVNIIACQSDKTYLQNLIIYNRNLEQRNALLKYFAANRTFNADTLEAYDLQLIKTGTYIHDKRNVLLKSISPVLKRYHTDITDGREDIDLVYESSFADEDPSKLLKNSLDRDLALQYTTEGIHRDDLKFTIDGYPIKKFGSQGQKKSFLIALQLAQFEFIRNHNVNIPLLLLDDIFDKLDKHRVKHLIDLVQSDDFGQIFISDTHVERTKEAVSGNGEDYEIFDLHITNNTNINL